MSELLEGSLCKEFDIRVLVVVAKVTEDLAKGVLNIEVALSVGLDRLNCLGHIHSNVWHGVLL